MSDVSSLQPGPTPSDPAILLIQTAFPFREADSDLPSPFPADVIPHFLQTQIRVRFPGIVFRLPKVGVERSALLGPLHFSGIWKVVPG